jgi:glycosyltransferase involved in cell wall biosynthesis
MYKHMRVAVVVPAYNERRAIVPTVATVPAFIDRVVVVDDASGDDTGAQAEIGAAERGGVVDVLRHDTNRGVGAAIATGYRHAFAHGADVAVVMAGDGQMDPSDLPALLDPIASDAADYVKGNRFLHPAIWTTMPPVRIVGNVLLSAATRVTSGYRHVFDSQCGYTAMTRTAFASLSGELWARYGYPNDLLSRLHVANMRVADVPVRPIYDEHWKSGINLVGVLRTFPRLLVRSWAARVVAERTQRALAATNP